MQHSSYNPIKLIKADQSLYWLSSSPLKRYHGSCDSLCRLWDVCPLLSLRGQVSLDGGLWQGHVSADSRGLRGLPDPLRSHLCWCLRDNFRQLWQVFFLYECLKFEFDVWSVANVWLSLKVTFDFVFRTLFCQVKHECVLYRFFYIIAMGLNHWGKKVCIASMAVGNITRVP